MPRSYQIELPEHEQQRLIARIEDDWRNALGDHRNRMERFARYYRKFRGLVDTPALGEEEASNFQVPLIQWQTYRKVAQEIQSLLGDDAEVVAKPVGPSDQRKVAKIGRYMTWRLFQSMRIVHGLSVGLFRKVLYGRAFWYNPWLVEKFRKPKKWEIDYEGPGWIPLAMDDVIVPAEDCQSLQEFSFVIRKYPTTPDAMLAQDGGIYQGIRANYQAIVDAARDPEQRDPYGDELKAEQDNADGVDKTAPTSQRNRLLVLEWYGKWRMLRGKAEDADEYDLKQREEFESELVVRYCPALRKIVGVQDLMELYPTMRDRRPIVESALVREGSYWGPGFGELLESLEDELSANHNLFTEAGEFTLGPLIFFRPSAGSQIEQMKYSPKTAIPTDDPGAVNVVTVRPNLEYAVVKDQAVMAIGERVTGQSDMSMGRSLDRPNAPRTATGQIALLEMGNIRAYLDTAMLREDMSLICRRVWDLDSEFAGARVFFRVSEEQAGGLFDVNRGGAYMTSQERGGRYDFDLKFATSVWSREARKQNQLALYQLDLNNPLVINNPKALWKVTAKVHQEFGDSNFADLIPAPPDLDAPKSPSEEWTLMLEGEEVQPNPLDNDQLHMVAHVAQLEEERAAKDADKQAIYLGIKHLQAHHQQQRTKMLMQSLTESLANSLATNTAQTGGLTVSANPVPVELQDLPQVIADVYGGQVAPGGPMPTGGRGPVSPQQRVEGAMGQV